MTQIAIRPSKPVGTEAGIALEAMQAGPTISTLMTSTYVHLHFAVGAGVATLTRAAV